MVTTYIYIVFFPHLLVANVHFSSSLTQFISNNYVIICTAFESAGVDLEKPIVTTCGGAVVACLLAFSLSQLGKSVPVYDVSATGGLTFSNEDHTSM